MILAVKEEILVKIITFVLLINIILMISLFSIIVEAAADSHVIFNKMDNAGDDYGPGTYNYPLNHIFKKEGHLFDLLSLTIYESEKHYSFEFKFTKLSDPWNSRFGFSLPLIEIYFDNKDGGADKLFQKGANISFSEDFKWDKYLKISGWWVRLFEPDDIGKDLYNLNENALIDPFAAKTAVVDKRENTIIMRIAKKELGLLDNSKFVLLIGSFDPFGFGHYRSVSDTPASWQLYDLSGRDIKKAPSVVDILVPDGKDQKKILSEGDLPVVPYLKLKPSMPVFKKLTAYYFTEKNLIIVFAFLFYLYLIYVFIKKYKV
ncbi:MULTISPECIES: glucodextranase DOMON-like domain-containing protein [unclassified Halanaerobium]|uniref:glucodextranase DOMON-like domain-containing protein n=1 Tax=unclassified Halanaerobium TaxID=2641197 RepID=UPI000DF29695|nr:MULTISPECIES: glucodextranase DOMON-like domain-containing protein [unclassified Halanaerobium]RCW45693.1 glucodextranase-like protein [Halanaerobium sp. MA284_MarDTE_T2]RCW88065.1 glucodextranase-like protein [Halanaerobium sp. DL-01]